MIPNVLTNKSTVAGSSFIQDFKFNNGHTVPLYEVTTTAAFNQLIGHAKVDNAHYGNVYYRGVNGLFDNVMPSIMRKRTSGTADDLNKILKAINENTYFVESLKLRKTIVPKISADYYRNKEITRFNRYCIEAVLQHYAGYTRFIDVVDNHWVALWMGLQKFITHGRGHKYCVCQKRELSIGTLYEMLKKSECPVLGLKSNIDIYEYIMLMAMPYASKKIECGIIETDELVEVDLRKSLPSFYLRPHAQHALVIRRREKQNINQTASYYDMASQVIAILRVRIDYAARWLGEGALLSQANLFPSPSVDQGYNNLLMHDEVFTYPFEILRYY